MFLSNLLKSASKNHRKILAKGISFDSRKVKKDYIFFAIKGNKTSGNKFINDALLNGASAIISNNRIKYKNKKIPLILVKDVRKSLSEACSNFYKQKPPNIIAVTGTNGKSSVADFFYQILNFNKIPVASIGTLGILSKKYSKKTNLTSMDPLSLHKNLQILTKNKIKYVILEASSHGLTQKRFDNLNITFRGLIGHFKFIYLALLPLFYINFKKLFRKKNYNLYTHIFLFIRYDQISFKI